MSDDFNNFMMDALKRIESFEHISQEQKDETRALFADWRGSQMTENDKVIIPKEEVKTMSNSKLNIYHNPNGNLQVVRVSEKCSACGACMAYADIFEDGPSGYSVPKNDGLIMPGDSAINDVKEAIDLCPEQAITLHKASVIKESGTINKQDLKNYIKEMLVDYKYPWPQYDDFWFRGSMPDVDGDGIWGWSSSTYSSNSRATDAGMSELKRVIFNNMDTLAKGMLADYKHTALTPLITYEQDERNYYYAEQQRVSTLIYAICLELKALAGVNVDAGELRIKTEPDLGYKCKNLKSLGSIEEELYGRAQEDVESPSWYEPWIDTDDYEETTTGLFGKLKYVTVYKYNAGDARREIRKHLESGGKDAVKKYLRDDYTFKKEFAALVAPIEKEVREKGERLLKMF